MFQYNELNHIYEKFLCSANANTTPEQGFQFGFAAGFILIIAIFYSPTFSSYRVKLDVKWNNAVCEYQLGGYLCRLIKNMIDG